MRWTKPLPESKDGGYEPIGAFRTGCSTTSGDEAAPIFDPFPSLRTSAFGLLERGYIDNGSGRRGEVERKHRNLG